MNDILADLMQVVEARRDADPKTSYVASLHARGLDTILKKVGEEATETVIAAKGGDRRQIVYEMADLWFHCLVLLSQSGIGVDEVLAELERRSGVSGHAEKAARGDAGGA